MVQTDVSGLTQLGAKTDLPASPEVAVLERVGEARWRLVVPWPRNESNLDLIELVPAG